MPSSVPTVQDLRELVNEVGQRVKEARQNRGLTQTEVADMIGISSKTISAIEVGRVEPSVSQIHALSKALHQPIGYFVGETQSSIASHMATIERSLNEVRQLFQEQQSN